MSERSSDPATVRVEFTAQQLELIDRLAMEWALSREATVQRILREESEGAAAAGAPPTET